jgi:acyl carrier protein
MENRIKQVMAAVFEVDVSEIDDNSSPDTIDQWDSLKHMNLILALEEEFEVRFDDEDIMNMITFESIFSILKNKMEKNKET